MSPNKPSNLSKEQLVAIVEQVQAILYQDEDANGEAIWTPDKEWDSDTTTEISQALNRRGLRPAEVAFVKE
jgi:hypothetical protein